MTALFHFADPALVFGDVGPPITAQQIGQAIPEAFPGKDGFVDFYSTYNGLAFPGTAWFRRERFHQVASSDYNRISLLDIYFIPRTPGEKDENLQSMPRAREIVARSRPELRAFVDSHLPFAADGSGNDYWIELATGRVMWRVLEGFEGPSQLVEVAPAFLDFVANLEAKRRPGAGSGAAR